MPRHIRVLMWAYEFINIGNPKFRRLPLGAIRRVLGLSAPFYDDWREVRRQLQRIKLVIHEQTNIRLVLKPIKVEGKVAEVQFDVYQRAKSD